MELKWEDGFEIKTSVVCGAIVISANRDGLLSLARHLNALADKKAGSHIHLDEYNSLETDSVELIIEKTE